MKVELKALKNYPDMGMEGGAWSATLYLDGKRVARVKDNGDGGGNYCEAYGPASKFAEQNAKLKEFYAWCKEQPDEQTKYGPLSMNTDYFLGILFEKEMLEKDLKRWARTSIVYRLKGDPKGSYQRVSPRKQEWIDQIKAEHGDKLEMIR